MCSSAQSNNSIKKVNKNSNKYKVFFFLLTVSTFLLNFIICEGGNTYTKKTIVSENKEKITEENQKDELEEQLSDLFANDFTFVDENNNEISVSSLKNRIIILVFSTTWCPKCPMVLKSFDTLQNKLVKKDIKDIEIIALNIGDDEISAVKNHYKKYEITNLKVYKSIDRIAEIEGVPATFIFDKKGKLIGKYYGWRDFASDDFLNFLKNKSSEKIN